MWAPSAAWMDHVRAYVWRDTRDCNLDENERVNRFPASPFCALHCLLDGEVDLIAHGDQTMCERMPPHMVAGCHTRPSASRNVGDLRVFSVALFPEAFHALFQIDVATLQDRCVDAHGVLPAQGRALFKAWAAASDAEACQAIFEDFLAAHASALPPSLWGRLRHMGSRVSLAIASRLLGMSPRQVQRTARRELGLSLREMASLHRGERAFWQFKQQRDQGQHVVWADHAAAAGYADQSHFARECKAQTGRTPTQFAHAMQHDEADWLYRLYTPHETSTPTRSP